MASINIASLTQIVLPKRKPNPKGQSVTSSYNPSSSATALAEPDYRAHLRDIFTDRTSQDARALITDLLKFDSDTSATLHAFLTIANVEPRFYVYDAEGNLDREGQKQFDVLKNGIFGRRDYSTGFEFTQSMSSLCENLRYCILWRGAIAAEMMFDKFLVPSDFRIVDASTINWYEKQPGIFKPEQESTASNQKILLDIPNFFFKYHRQNPTELYPQSPFVSAINTIAARQQVINDLYRIMQKTGYPRIEVTVIEEILRKNAPASVKASEAQLNQWMSARLSEIANGLTDMRPDAAYVHFDAIETKILNEGGPGKSMDVKSIIDVLNAQNQAALKTMASIIGRGESGVNTATVEARIFSMSAQEINVPIADMFSDAFTLAMRTIGYPGFVKCVFDDVEMRPKTELEPQLTLRQSRLLQSLSLGLITDEEFHITMYNRLRPDSSPELSGTGFMDAGSSGNVDAGSVSPNSDPLGRSVSSEGSKSAKSNAVKKGSTK